MKPNRSSARTRSVTDSLSLRLKLWVYALPPGYRIIIVISARYAAVTLLPTLVVVSRTTIFTFRLSVKRDVPRGRSVVISRTLISFVVRQENMLGIPTLWIRRPRRFATRTIRRGALALRRLYFRESRRIVENQ